MRYDISPSNFNTVERISEVVLFLWHSNESCTKWPSSLSSSELIYEDINTLIQYGISTNPSTSHFFYSNNFSTLITLGVKVLCKNIDWCREKKSWSNSCNHLIRDSSNLLYYLIKTKRTFDTHIQTKSRMDLKPYDNSERNFGKITSPDRNREVLIYDTKEYTNKEFWRSKIRVLSE